MHPHNSRASIKDADRIAMSFALHHETKHFKISLNRLSQRVRPPLAIRTGLACLRSSYRSSSVRSAVVSVYDRHLDQLFDTSTDRHNPSRTFHNSEGLIPRHKGEAEPSVGQADILGRISETRVLVLIRSRIWKEILRISGLHESVECRDQQQVHPHGDS